MCRCASKYHVNWKFELPTNGRDAPDNVGTFDCATVPCIRCKHGGWEPDSEGVAVVFGDGNGFVNIAKEPFNTDGFVVTAGCQLSGVFPGKTRP